MDVMSESPKIEFSNPNKGSRFLKIALPYLLCGLSTAACSESRSVIGEVYSSNETQLVSQSMDATEVLGDSSPTTTTIVLDDIRTAIDPAVMQSAERLEEVKPYTVDIFGDSIVNGYLVCGGGSPWPAQLERALYNRVNGMQVKITNYSVPGETIISPTPQNWRDQDGNNLGGSLVDKVIEQIPPTTEASALPDLVVIVPSINEFILSGKPTDDEKIQYALDALRFINNYLRGIGVSKVLFTQMLRPSNGWEAPQNIKDIQNIITEFNLRLGQVFDGNTLGGNNLDFADPIGSDEEFFKYDSNESGSCLSDGLHPTATGQTKIAQQLLSSVLDLDYL